MDGSKEYMMYLVTDPDISITPYLSTSPTQLKIGTGCFQTIEILIFSNMYIRTEFKLKHYSPYCSRL